jgi:hemin uptake protein HemP
MMKRIDDRSDDTQRPPLSGLQPVTQSLLSMPSYRFLDLSQSGTEVLIEHEGQIYRLRNTRNGKLILNK